MVNLRVARCYRRLERPYTRKSKYKKKGYIKAFPHHKISGFEMGDKTKLYGYKVKLVSNGSYQIRHNALESARMVINRNLQEVLGNNYFLRLNVYPHHALRENKMLGGAHADRLQSGMAHSFGKVSGTAEQVMVGNPIFTVWVDKENIDKAKEALQTANPRLPGNKCLIEIETNTKSLK